MLKRPRQVEAALRTAVHVGLLASVTASLAVEPVLTAHVVLGLLFVGLVVMHLVQRNRTIRSLSRPTVLIGWSRAGRMAWADALLGLLTLAMFVSGLVDWAEGHPTRVRWHAITGVLLVGYLLLHTIRRRRRLTRSIVR